MQSSGFLLLTACGVRPTPAPAPPSPFKTPRPRPSSLPGESLRVLGPFTGDDEGRIRASLDQFTQTQGVSVTYAGAGEVATQLREQVEAGGPPDVVFLPKAAWVAELARGGVIQPLSEPVAAAVRTNFPAAWQARVAHEKRLFGVPFDANAKSLLWVRPAALAAVGANSPETLDGLFALAEALGARGETPFAVPGGAGWPLTDWFEAVLLADAGPEAYDALHAHGIAWTDPVVSRAAGRYGALLRSEWVMGGSEGAATLPLDPDAFRHAFDPQAPGATMWLGQGSIVTPYAVQGGLRPGQDFDLFPFPAGGGMIVIGSTAVATSTRPEAAALLGFLAQPEAVGPWIAAGGSVSPNLALPLDLYPSALAQKEARLLREARFLRDDLSDGLPPQLGFPFLGDQLREGLRRPADLPDILEAIEAIATREQGRPTSGTARTSPAP